MSHEFIFRQGYYSDPRWRASLNAFAREAFNGLDFGPWNSLGCEFTEYTPFSLFQGEQVAANVSASPMTLVLNGRRTAAVQIGTVATRPELRRRGLIRELINKAHNHWESEGHRLFILVANPGSAQFYQQFGYRQIKEHTFQTRAPEIGQPASPGRLLDLRERADLDLFLRLAEQRAPISQRLGIVDQAWLLAFHAATVHPQRLLFFEHLDVLTISTIQGKKLRLIDVIGTQIPSLRELYPFIAGPGVETVGFQFTPDLMGLPETIAAPAPDSLLFVRGPFELENQRFRFPDTSQA